MSQIVQRAPGVVIQQSKLFDALPDEHEDLTAGVAVSFPILGIKGKAWHYRFKGDDTIIADARGFAVPFVEVVILKAQKELSRTMYPAGSYVDSDDANRRPACWSSNGVHPDEDVREPVNPVCATCPNAEWGSGATTAAPRAQACQQRRRTVIVPYSDDLTNEGGGGPVLLSVPPGSLKNQVEYGEMLHAHSAHYASCVTQLSFAQDEAFPRIVFDYAKPLTDEEAAVILSIRDNDTVERILNSKINVDGPETADGPAAPAETPASAAPKSAPPVTPKQTTSGIKRPATQAAAPVSEPAPAAPAATTALKVGGFAVGGTKAKAAAPAAPAKGAAPINAAVAKASPAPPSARKVATAPAPAPAPEAEAETEIVDDLPVPDELTTKFERLMNPNSPE
jgi:hypothetical protein